MTVYQSLLLVPSTDCELRASLQFIAKKDDQPADGATHGEVPQEGGAGQAAGQHRVGVGDDDQLDKVSRRLCKVVEMVVEMWVAQTTQNVINALATMFM